MIDPLDALREAIRAVVREELAKLQAPDVLTTAEAARLARLRPDTIREWIANGKLKATRAGRSHRIRRADLEAAMTAPRLVVVPESAARRRFG